MIIKCVAHDVVYESDVVYERTEQTGSNVS